MHVRTSVTTDNMGRTTLSVHSIDFENDGVIDETQTESWTYNAHGKVTRDRIAVTVAGGQLVYLTQSDFEYNQFDDRTVGTSQTDYDGDGVVDDRGMSRIVYTRSAGRVTKSVETNYDVVTNLPRAVNTITYSFDQHGNVTLERTESDNDANGTIDQWQQFVRTYDNHGNKLSEISDSDYNGDGVSDFTNTIRYTYDSSGNVIREVQNDVYVYIRTFDSKNRILSERTELDIGLDLILDDVTLTTWVRDSKGNAVTEIFESGLQPGSTLQGYQTTTRTFDAKGHRLSEIYEQDDFHDGTIESRQVTLDTYDSSGRLVKETSEQTNDTGYRYYSESTYSYS